VPWRPIVLIGIAVTLMYVADSATSNWSADYLRRGLDSGATFAAWGYAAYQTFMVAGRVLADRLVRRFGSVTAVRVGAAVGTVGLALTVAAPDAVVGIAGFGVLGLGLCVVVPESFSAAGRYDPTGSGLAVSRVNLFNYLGFLIGAPLVGAVEVVANWRAGFAVPLVLVAAIIPLGWVFRPRPAAPQQPATPLAEPDPAST
jgi:MFS family permease